MKTILIKIIMSTCAMLLVSTILLAQIPNDSPAPVDFIVTDVNGNESIFKYSSMVDFGVNLLQTVSGELEWARDDGMYDVDGDGNPDPGYLDSMNCSWGNTQPLKGKMALIRKGSCFFSQKIYNAQVAGAVGVIICNDEPDEDLTNMAGADSAAVINIPAIFISYEDCELISIPVDNGESTIATFEVKTFSGALGPYAYGTPLEHVRPMEDIQVTFVNTDTLNALVNTIFTVEITAPNGMITTLTETIDVLLFEEERLVEFDDYTPDQIGDYIMTYSNSATDEVLQTSFKITEYTFQMDNGIIDGHYSDTQDARIDMGNMYLTGPNGGTATQASFAIQNYNQLQFYDIDFTISLYDCDPDGDGIGPDGTETNYSNWPEVGQATYEITGVEDPYQEVFAVFENPVPLKPNGQYLLMVKCDTTFFLTETPYYAYAGTEEYPYFSTAILVGNELNLNGLYNNNHNIARLHTNDIVDTEDIQSLAANKINVAPNPATNYINLDLSLDKVAEKVEIKITDSSGKLFVDKILFHVQNEVTTFNTSSFTDGTYFMSVKTPEGFRSLKFTVLK